MSSAEDKTWQTIFEEARFDLRTRIQGYELLLVEYQTPLFRNELLDAIKLHEEAIQRPDPTPAERERVVDQLDVLDKMDGRLHKHWKELQKNMSFRIVLLASIADFQRFLGAWLMLEYTGKCIVKSHNWAVGLVNTIDDVGSGTGRIDEEFSLYQQTFVRPLKEMMLNRDHVEGRIRAASAGSTHPAGEIHRMIDQCDWPNLAAAVVSDRELAATLFGAKQVNKDIWSPQFGRSVLQKVDDTRDKYFAQLSTTTKYTLSRRARELSAKKAARAARQSSSTHSSPASVRNPEDSSAVAAAKSVYSKVVSGLGLGRTVPSLRSFIHRGTSTTSPGASLDSTTQLIGEKEKAG
ncbi:hypothetical protein INS49_008930 [Diaporthe citri]|uniref:uncharacterized protein n=1 Tax=Diaporthe citri TaxID=83186 RepID=UPI001C7EBF7B|nr:uncharacterized protein INS49_008930 [Diaporthe citri]KAG6363827.1 hypothetical protein INS49_008930 [Diaporthe citri]